MRKKQVSLYLAKDFVAKSKNAAIGFFLINIVFSFAFIFVEKDFNHFWREIVIFSLTICLLSVFRFFICDYFHRNHQLKLIGTSRFYKLIYALALINSILWAIVSSLIFFGGKESITAMISVLLVTIAFSANSISTLGINRGLLLMFNSIITLPPIMFYFNNGIVGSYFNLQLITGLMIINLIYTVKQAAQVSEDYISKIENILNLRKLNNELLQSQRNLEEQTLKTFHANRLASLGEMAGGISHEINNPLTIITGMTNSVLRNEEDTAKKEKLNRVLMAADRIAKIVRSMKVLSTNSDGADFDICSLSEVMESSLDLVKEKFKSTDIKLHLQEIPSLSIRCNKIQISQVIINLLNNANDAIEKLDGPKDLYISFEVLSSHLNINVFNNGPEIPRNVVENLFVPFFTTKPVGKGTGLGLSISKSLMQKHNGDLYYKRIGELTCFTISLPR